MSWLTCARSEVDIALDSDSKDRRFDPCRARHLKSPVTIEVSGLFVTFRHCPHSPQNTAFYRVSSL